MNYAPQAIALFFASILLTLFVGAPLQMWHSHFGLVGSELLTILLPAVLVLFWCRRQKTPPELFVVPKMGMTAGWLVWVALMSLLLGLAANAVTSLIAQASPSLLELSKSYEEMFYALMYPDDAMLRVVAVLSICVVAPLCEEFLFRGVILPLQETSGRGTIALIVANGVMFALLHLNPLNFLALAAIGAFFAHVSLVTRSLWPSVLGHATLNFVNGVVVPEVLRAQGTAGEPSILVFAVSAVLLVPITAGLWLWGARKLPGPLPATQTNHG